MGSIGATVSLLANALGAPLFGEKSLQLIRVYLTFPMGARALEAKASNAKRFVVSTLIGLALWIANFYLILSWLQPMLQGDNWIVFLGEFWGKFETNAPRTA